MPPQTIALLLGLLELATKAVPIIQGLHLGGTVTVEDQAKLSGAYKAFRDAGDLAFAGPEWETVPAPAVVSPDVIVPGPTPMTE